MSNHDTKSRLRLFQHDKDACEAAIRGEKVPHALGLPLTRHCVVRGMRYHHGFGEELRGVLPEFTRTLNARSIMSGHVPEMSNETEFPYCIWYPQVATEATYRELAHRYPDMIYQVGRACAVAGYFDLYKELDILPEVHNAEEARDYGNLAIYEDIMSKPVRYAVMDDYTRTVSAVPRAGACLNGDTAVRGSLEKKQAISDADDFDISDDDDEPFYFLELRGYDINTFDITEDMNIDVQDTKVPAAITSPLMLDLLSSPLPFDLPAVDKDLLILMAAYHGDIDRYVRLRRPEPIYNEISCCIRGIYHNTMFAVWWSKQQQVSRIDSRIDRAVSARMIMNNVLHRMQAPSKQHADPYMIWFPSIAAESTYRELYRLRPSMAPQILRACITGGYSLLFKEIVFQVQPDEAVVAEANLAGGTFKDDIQKRVAELDGKVTPIAFHEQWKRFSVTAEADGLYEGYVCRAQGIEVLMSTPDEWKNFPGHPLVELDYKEWP